MRLIGAGLPRTGTLSQKVALEMLGLGPCYHMVNVLANLTEVQKWQAAYDGNADWPGIFDGFQSTVDWPGSFFYKDLIEAYPNAKVVLSTRNPQSWVRSMRDTVWGVWYADILIRDLSSARRKVDPSWNAFAELMYGVCDRSGLMPGATQATPEAMGEAMVRFEEEVTQAVPADRLLVWAAADGWEPLCEFLGLQVPDTPFPHLNDSQEFQDRIVDGSLQVLQAWRSEQEPASASQ